MVDPFDSPLALLERAKRHILEVEKEVAGAPWMGCSSPYTEMDAPGVNVRFKVKLNGVVPVTVAVVVFDVLSELRAALDHAVFAAAIYITGQIDPENTKFPFGDDSTDARKDFYRRKPPAHLDALAELCVSLEAFKGGVSEPVYLLNKMRNGKLHRSLSPMALASSAVTYSGEQNFDAEGYRTVSRWDYDTGELTFLEIDKLFGEMPRPEPIVELAFAESTYFAGKPMLETLKNLNGRVNNMVVTIKDFAKNPEGSVVMDLIRRHHSSIFAPWFGQPQFVRLLE